MEDGVSTTETASNGTIGNVTECVPQIDLSSFPLYSLIPAAAIIIILSFFEKRRHARHCRCLGDRPGLLFPVNMLDDDNNRYAYAAAFGCTATNCLTLFSEDFFPQGSPLWSLTLYALITVLVLGFSYYPIFACLSTKQRIVGSLLGVLYALTLFLDKLASVIQCTDVDYVLFPRDQIVIQLPVLLCLLFLVFKFAYTLGSKTVTWFRQVRTAGSLRTGLLPYHSQHPVDDCLHMQLQPLAKPYHKDHVRRLLKKTEDLHGRTENQLDGIGSVLCAPRWYKSDPTFKFSTKIIAVVVVALFVLYEMVLITFLGWFSLFDLVTTLLDDYEKAKDVDESVHHQLSLAVYVSTVAFYIALGLASLTTIAYIVTILVTYRDNMRKLYRGEKSHITHEKWKPSTGKLLSKNLMYPGTQIAFLLWGYYLMVLVIFTVEMLIAYLIILPIIGEVPSSLLNPFFSVVPALLVSLLLDWVQKLIAKRGLLQTVTVTEAGRERTKRVLALDNRKVYHNLSFFLFFFYIVIGFFQAIMRVFIGMVLGVIYLGRLDKSGLVIGYEHWDYGYLRYISFLQTEVAHRHPVLVTFCHVLIDSLNRKQEVDLWNYGTCTDGVNAPISTQQRMVRNRWLKAYTLIRNPGILEVKVEQDLPDICERIELNDTAA